MFGMRSGPKSNVQVDSFASPETKSSVKFGDLYIAHNFSIRRQKII